MLMSYNPRHAARRQYPLGRSFEVLSVEQAKVSGPMFEQRTAITGVSDRYETSIAAPQRVRERIDWE